MRKRGFPNVVLTSLTERGRKVAKRVGEIGGILRAGAGPSPTSHL